ncbi:MAG: heavy metal-associated domain-containing protein [Rhodoblastus sp.]
MLDRPAGKSQTAEYVFPVDGMTCASCSLRVEKALCGRSGREERRGQSQPP